RLLIATKRTRRLQEADYRGTRPRNDARNDHPVGARGGGTVTTWCRPACINPQTARSPMNTASRSRLAIPATQTLPWSRGFKLTHYIAHAPSGARPCAATARDPRRSLRDRDRCKPGGWPTPRGAELGRRDLGPAAEPRGSW